MDQENITHKNPDFLSKVNATTPIFSSSIAYLQKVEKKETETSLKLS